MKLPHLGNAQVLQKKAKEDLRKGSTNASTFISLYNRIEDSYGIDSIGYWCVIGVLERNTTLAEDTNVCVSFRSF